MHRMIIWYPYSIDNDVISHVTKFSNSNKIYLVTYLASSKRPVTNSRPLNAMKVSRPQQRMNPVAKCGRPAANEPSGVDIS